MTDATVPYTSVRTYRFTSPTATIASGTLVATTTLVTDQEKYTVTHFSGTVSNCYRNSFYNTTTLVESGLGAIIQPPNLTVRTVRLDCARQAYGGFDGTCSSVGTSTTLIDSVLSDTGKDAYFMEGSFLYRPDAAAAADALRRVTEGGFAASTGTLTVTRAWATPPASA